MPSPSTSRPRLLARSAAVATAMAVLAMLAACTDEPVSKGGESVRPDASPTVRRGAAPPSPPGPDPRPVLARMSLREKVGQLFVVRIKGTTPAAARRPIERYDVGGVIYFPANLRDPEQIAGLSAGLQRAALARPPKVPLLIGIDQEQGRVNRLGDIATRFPGAMAAAATGREAQAEAMAHITGIELRAMGLNLDYAPVADVNVNPANPVIGVRSFGSDPARVARMVAAQVRGFQAAGVGAVAKHFPGHGDTDVDSHTGLPSIGHSRAEWERIDAPPFRAAIAAGADAVLSAHIRVDALDPSGRPATLSGPILTGLLRERLGFRGVIATDALEMAGVREKYGDGEVAVRAVLAGADQLLMPPDLGEAYDAVLKAVRSGRISRARLDAAVLRTLTLKQTRGLFAHPEADPARAAEVVRSAPHRAAARRLAELSITLVRNDDGVLPLRPGARVRVIGPDAAGLAEQLRAAGLRVVRGAGRADAVVSGGAAGRDGKAPAITVGTGAPYDAGDGGSRGYVAAYSSSTESLRAAARVIAGHAKPTGRLPVHVPGDKGRPDYPAGHGLSY
ncbi:MAG: beta-hexosaminidase [Streptosporangiales bacterium]|nr:beta-hexosaminidase [Streptosporangiales bacterium]